MVKIDHRLPGNLTLRRALLLDTLGVGSLNRLMPRRRSSHDERQILR